MIFGIPNSGGHPEPAAKIEYIEGQRLAVKLPNGQLEEIEKEQIRNILFAGKYIPDVTPLTKFPIVVL